MMTRWSFSKTLYQENNTVGCRRVCWMMKLTTNTRRSRMKTFNIFLSHNLLNASWNCRTSWTICCADPWLISWCAAISFTVTRRFSFTMVSTAAMASDVTTRRAWPGRGESVTEIMAFMNFLVHPYTCCSDRHASPYWTFICRWISMGFTPSLFKKRTTEHCSLLVHIASGAAIFTLLLRRRVEFLHRTTTCRPVFKPWVSLLSSYKTIELCFGFLSHLS